MTTEELRQYKQDYNARIANLKKEYYIKSLEIEKDEIMTKLFEAINDHEKVCEEFDREKE